MATDGDDLATTLREIDEVRHRTRAARSPGMTHPAHGDAVLALVFGIAFTATGLLLRRRDPVA